MKTLEELAKGNPILIEELKKTLTKEQLASTLPSDISDLETIIFSDMQQIMLQECVGLTLVRTIDLSGKKTDYITVPKELAPASPLPPVAEGDTVIPRKFLLDTKPITLSQRWGDDFSLAKDSVDDCEVDLVNLGKDNMAKEFAQGLDEYLFSVLLRETTYTQTISGSTAHAIYQLAHSPVIEVVSIKNDAEDDLTLQAIDEFEGKVQIDESLSGDYLHITYKASAHALVKDAKTDKVLAFEDLSAGYDMARAKYETMHFAVVHPRGKSDLIADEKFLWAYAGMGKQAPISTNEIGQAAGMKVLVSSRIPEGCCLLVDVPRFVWALQKGGVKVSTLDQPASDVIDFYFFLRSGADVLDEYAAVLITNIGSKSADL
jgi:hypothetical protein